MAQFQNASIYQVVNFLMRASAMGMQPGWVPHLPSYTRNSTPHVLQGSHTLQTHCCSIDVMHVCPVVELQPATVSMGTVTATLATLVPT